MNDHINNAIIVSLDDDVSEITELADSLNYKVVKTFFQHRKNPDVNTYIGSGKIDEIKEFIKNSDEIKLIIVNGELKPSQWFNLEKDLDLKVYDRVRLILAIFEERADKNEAKLQVKLAQLQYERPFVRELIHRTKAGEHPGYMAGGEYQVDDYYEMIKKQMKKIKEQLDNIRDQREVRRGYRHKSGFYLVSIAGYTNAGKSSLLNILTGEKVKVEDRLFSTLSTTTRKLENKTMPILLTDTVGFIQNLPAYVIDAFHSTLEEIEVADVVLLIVDVSEEKEVISKKLSVSLDELIEIGVTAPIILVLNKSDLISRDLLDEKVVYLRRSNLIEDRNIVAISVKNQENIDRLLKIVHESLPQLVRLKIKLPVNTKSQSIISWIYEKASVLEISYNSFVTLEVECNNIVREKIISECKNLEGSQIF